MKITVLNGSPKGNLSVTDRHVQFFKLAFPDHEIESIPIAKDFKKFETDDGFRGEVLGKIKESDMVLFAWPVYYMTVPAQYMRFFELLRELSIEHTFAGKPAALFSTSIHYFDHTAHDYMRAQVDELRMKFCGSLSAHMNDMTKEDGRKTLKMFMVKSINNCVEKLFPHRQFQEFPANKFIYKPTPENRQKEVNLKVLIVTDHSENTNLSAMVSSAAAVFNPPAQVVHLSSLKMVSGCIGCLKCAGDLICRFNDKDGHRNFIENEMKQVDAIIFAADLKTGYFSSTWQTFITRMFYNGHMPVLNGKCHAFLLSGALGHRAYIRELLEGMMLHTESTMAGVVTDEEANSAAIDQSIEWLSHEISYRVKENYKPFNTFPAVSGHKIFRDELYGAMGIVFSHDYDFYKRNGLFDFPTGRIGFNIVKSVGRTALKFPPLRRRFYNKEMMTGMLRPYEKVISKMKK
ncbi:NAD(P)H-dependent oxidoreductase [Myxococcota bacterium]|nr:NAD(P)H-dependent oxidoreductase [Myxococcota bacterium]MBU1381849.1 NAD(P)H-dependent oxidoreductase [Myxococcota bacterium]MBU1495584.1 NAD(P)H-dependent oxidoreductase [Myxococcota bacterium]